MIQPKYAPIVVFAFNRLNVLQNAIKTLQTSPECKYSDLFVYVDGPRDNKEGEAEKVQSVRDFVNTISGFKSVTRIFSERNKGLAPSIIAGVTEVLRKYKRVIVVEDDLYLAPSFLKYMNQMLDTYENMEKVMQVSGFGLKIKRPKDYKYDTFFNVRGQCWSWGTWYDRWVTIDWDLKDWDELVNNKQKQKAFNRAGSDMFDMLKAYKDGRSSSWFIRVCYSMFLQDRYTVCPIRSLVVNDGFGAEGTHCNRYNRFKVDLNTEKQYHFITPETFSVNKKIIKENLWYHSIPIRAYSKLRAYLSGNWY